MILWIHIFFSEYLFSSLSCGVEDEPIDKHNFTVSLRSEWLLGKSAVYSVFSLMVANALIRATTLLGGIILL